jgi:acyl dehydratase
MNPFYRGPVRTSDRHELIAHNTATASANKIHDDAVARRYGFRGGLVPGVDVYAYMTRAPVAAWGLDWLGRGSLRARFLAPVYEGQRVVVVGESAGGRTMSVELQGEDGAVCATGEAALPADGGDPPQVSALPAAEPYAPTADTHDLPPASPDSLRPGTTLAIPTHRFHADQAEPYLAGVREELPLYADHKVAHPGWLLRDANYVLSGNVRLGPWIHVESHVRHHGLVHDHDDIQARAVVTREWAHKGHRFVELDVGLIVNAERVTARITHIAIYEPRRG